MWERNNFMHIKVQTVRGLIQFEKRNTKAGKLISVPGVWQKKLRKELSQDNWYNFQVAGANSLTARQPHFLFLQE